MLLFSPISSHFVEKSMTCRELVAFDIDEAIDIPRPHTTPPHRWRAAERALEAPSRLAEDPPPICSFKTMLAMREGLQCEFVRAPPPGRASPGARFGPWPCSWPRPCLFRRTFPFFGVVLFRHHTGELQRMASQCDMMGYVYII